MQVSDLDHPRWVSTRREKARAILAKRDKPILYHGILENPLLDWCYSASVGGEICLYVRIPYGRHRNGLVNSTLLSYWLHCLRCQHAAPPHRVTLPYRTSFCSALHARTLGDVMVWGLMLFVLSMLFQGVDAVSQVYLYPDNAKSREKFELLWTSISGGVPTVPVVLR